MLCHIELKKLTRHLNKMYDILKLTLCVQGIRTKGMTNWINRISDQDNEQKGYDILKFEILLTMYVNEKEYDMCNKTLFSWRYLLINCFLSKLFLGMICSKIN